MSSSFEESPEYQIEVERRRALKAEKTAEENSAIARGVISAKEEEIKALRSQLALAQQGQNSTPNYLDESDVKPHLKWEPFPLKMLPDTVQEYVRAHAAAKNCDPAFIAAPALGVLAAAVGNSYSIALKNSWAEISALWISIIAPSGSYKTPGIHAAVSPIYRQEQLASDEYNEAQTLYESELERYKTKKPKERLEEEKPLRPNRRRFKTGDATLESFVLVHAQNPRGVAVVRDELAGWFGSFDRYAGKGSSDMQAWIEMHGGKPVTVDRKTSDIPVLYLPSPNATVIGGIQPKVFKNIIGPQFFSSGFIARVLMVMPPKKKKRWTDADVDLDVKDRYIGLIDRLYSYQPLDGKPVEIPLSHDAKKLWVDYYNEHAELTDNLPDGALRAAMTKLEFMASRFALILQLASETAGKPREISYTAMFCAINLARWFRRETARIYLELDFEGSSMDELQRLVLKLPNPFRYQDLEALQDIQKSGAFKKIRKMEGLGYIEHIAENKYAHRIDQFMIDWSLFENNPMDTGILDTLDTLQESEQNPQSVQSVPVSSVSKDIGQQSRLEFEPLPEEMEAPF